MFDLNIINPTTEQELDYRSIVTDLDIQIAYLNRLDSYSEESFSNFLRKTLTKIADFSAGIILLNKTNIKNIFKGMKRSELRAYVDRYHFTIKKIEALNYMKMMEQLVPAATGQKGKTIDVVNFLKEAYDEMNIGATINFMLSDSKDIYYNVMKSTKDKDFAKNINNKDYSKTYTAKTKLLDGVVSKHLKIFESSNRKSNIETKDLKFKKIYGSMKEMVQSKETLLNLESTYLASVKSSDVSEKINDNIEALIEAINMGQYKPNKKFVVSLASIVKTMALYFETIAVLLKTQLVSEHNMVLQYNQLEPKD